MRVTSLRINGIRVCANSSGNGAATTLKLTVHTANCKLSMLVLRFTGGLRYTRRSTTPHLKLQVMRTSHSAPRTYTTRVVRLTHRRVSRISILVLSRLNRTVHHNFIAHRSIRGLVTVGPSAARLVLANHNLLPLTSLTSLIARVHPVGRCFSRNLLTHRNVRCWFVQEMIVKSTLGQLIVKSDLVSRRRRTAACVSHRPLIPFTVITQPEPATLAV